MYIHMSKFKCLHRKKPVVGLLAYIPQCISKILGTKPILNYILSYIHVLFNDHKLSRENWINNKQNECMKCNYGEENDQLLEFRCICTGENIKL